MSEAKTLLGIEDVSDENINSLIRELLEEKNLEAKSELNQNQINAIARASWFADKYESQNMRTIIKYILKYLISKDRHGRQELVEALTGMFKYNLEKQKTEKIEL